MMQTLPAYVAASDRIATASSSNGATASDRRDAGDAFGALIEGGSPGERADSARPAASRASRDRHGGDASPAARTVTDMLGMPTVIAANINDAAQTLGAPAALSAISPPPPARGMEGVPIKGTNAQAGQTPRSAPSGLRSHVGLGARAVSDGALSDGAADPPALRGVAVRSGSAAASGQTSDRLPPITERVNVIASETHLAPTPPLSPAAQIADALISSAADDAAPSLSPTPTIDANADTARQSSGEKLRVLVVDLNPDALGPVQVRMRLVGQELRVAIVAQTKDAVAAIDASRAELSDRCAGAGYQLAALDIASMPAVGEGSPATTSGDGGGARQQNMEPWDGTGHRAGNEASREQTRRDRAQAEREAPRGVVRDLGDRRL